MNINCPADHLMLRARLEARARGVPYSVCVQVWELSDNGIALFEIAAITGLPRPLINLILRGAAPGVPK